MRVALLIKRNGIIAQTIAQIKQVFRSIWTRRGKIEAGKSSEQEQTKSKSFAELSRFLDLLESPS
jgi:acyl-[acyl carrier protein]--UDP-N-acetylglucosamine O-acyltransferase